MRLCKNIITTGLFLFLSFPVLASDVIFAPDSSVGFKPPGKMIAKGGIVEFADVDEGAFILISGKDNSFDNEPLWNGDVLQDRRLEKPERYFKLGGDIEARLVIYSRMHGNRRHRYWLMVVRNVDQSATIRVWAPADSKVYTDAEIMEMLRSIEFRPNESLEDDIVRLPFTVGDRANFHAVQTIGGNTLLLMHIGKSAFYLEPQPIATIGFTRYDNPLIIPQDEGRRKQLALMAILSLDFTDIQITTTEVNADGDVLITATGIEPEGKKKALRQIMRFALDGHVRTVCVSRPQHDITARCDQMGRSVMIKMLD